jgi:hypothetical protein
MIWLAWRQFRTQALTGLIALLLLTIFLVVTGEQLRHTYDVDLAQCRGHGDCVSILGSFTSQYSFRISLLGYLLIAVPGVIGIFWGAPLVTRELEAGTHRLVWNQSVSRTRWLVVKLGFVSLAGMVAAGLYSLLLTWAASPVDLVRGDRFSALLFDARNIVPVGYAAFAVVLGVTVGLFVRRTVPAMACMLVIFAVVQVLVPTLIRPNYVPPIRTAVPLTAQMITNLSFLGEYGDIGGLALPGGPWVVSTSSMLNPAGQEVGHTAWYANCLSESMADVPVCLTKGDVHVEVSAQPADRYWSFQWYETAIFAALAILLAGLCLWRIRGRLT